MLFKSVTTGRSIEDYILMEASPRFVSDDKRELSYQEKQELNMLFDIWDADDSGELEADDTATNYARFSIESHDLDRIIKGWYKWGVIDKELSTWCASFLTTMRTSRTK